MTKRHRRSMGENGFAAIIISIVLVVVLSLITVGFASLMRKEQRSALDRQLSDAAYYAAESGINDAAAAVRAGFTATKDTCDPYTPATIAALPGNNNKNAAGKYLVSSTVDNKSNTSYTCLLINPNPATLEYSSVNTGEATTAVLTGSSAAGTTTNVNTLVFSWQDANGGQTFGPPTSGGLCPPVGANAFPPVSCWKNGGSAMTGILRISLTPVPHPAAFSRSTLETTNYTAYLYPNGGGATSTPTTLSGSVVPSGVPSKPYAAGVTGSQNGTIITGACNTGSTPRYCAAAVTGLNTDTYLLHLSSIYAATQVTVTPYSCVGSNCTRIYLKGAQTLIDSTGKSQDVLKRIQVRMPSRNSFDYPEFSIATGGPVCKQLTTWPQNQTTGTPGDTVNLCDPL
ncbi:MAG TPA: PilX N-terminal domain-containing pilus assembly protein [Candidatus Saccharimonadales bacterium]|nr:PilX N-terminal domain-containing pilus assembly protein [Candidatus Saccharimonadales bacterium]